MSPSFSCLCHLKFVTNIFGKQKREKLAFDIFTTIFHVNCKQLACHTKVMPIYTNELESVSRFPFTIMAIVQTPNFTVIYAATDPQKKLD